MNSRRKLIKEIPITGNSEVNVIEVEFYFSKGGINYFNYQNEPRGYYLSVCPYKVSFDGHFKSKCYGAFSGLKALLEQSTRFSQKKFDNFHICENIIQRQVSLVLTKNNLSLSPTKKAA